MLIFLDEWLDLLFWNEFNYPDTPETLLEEREEVVWSGS